MAKSLFISLKTVWPLFLWEQKTAIKKTRFNKREEGRRSQPFSESLCTAFPLSPPSFLPNQVHSFSPGPESQSEPYVGHVYIRQKRLPITSVSAGRFKGRLQSFMGLLWFKRGLMFGFWHFKQFYGPEKTESWWKTKWETWREVKTTTRRAGDGLEKTGSTEKEDVMEIEYGNN